MANIILNADPGVSLGSNLDAAPHEIPAGQGRFVQDALLDRPGIVRQRGPITNLSTDFPSLPSSARVIGMTSLADPNSTNAFRLLLLVADKNTFAVKAYIYGRQSVPVTPTFSARAFFDQVRVQANTGRTIGNPYLYFMDRRTASQNSGALLATLTLSGLQILNSDPDPFFQSSLSLDGGALFGMGINFGADANTAHRAMFHWRGAAKADYTTGTITFTANSPVVTGVGTTWLTNVEPGMFLQNAAGTFTYGIVKTVTDNTHITLEQNALSAAGAGVGYKFTSLRRPYSQGSSTLVSAGTIVTSITSAVVNGGGTKFVDQGVANGDLVFRASDNTFVGTVTTIQSNSQLTLTGNAAVALANEDYLITRTTPWAAGKEPVFATFFSGMQLLANADNIRGGINERSRIFVTDAKNLEAIDLTKTGSFYDLPSTKPHTDIRGLVSTESAALVFLAEATYGLYGNTPDNLVPKVIASDGLLSPMSIQPWQGGVIWAGFQSVYYFDGASVHDMLAGKVQATHSRAIAGVDYTKYRAWSMLYSNHYVCFLQNVNTGNFTHFQGRQNTIDPGGVTFDPSTIVYVINLETGAIGFWTNVSVRGYTSPPGALISRRDAYYVVESSVTNGPIICSADALFAQTGSAGFTQDAILTNPTASDFAPHFYVEGRLNSFGDPELLKRAAMILVQYSLYGGSANSKLGIDIVTDMGETTKAISPKDRTSTNVAVPISWKNKRSRFGKKANLIGARFYTMVDGQPTAAYVGPWSLGYKPMRVGRV